jgi:hypothetical protein
MEDWKEQALKYEKLTEHNKRILREGPKGLAEAWFLGAMKRKYYQGPGGKINNITGGT